MRRALVLCICVVNCFLLAGQTIDNNYDYIISLSPQDSKCTTAIVLKTLPTDSSVLHIVTLNAHNDTIHFATIAVKGAHTDTLLYSDFSGFASLSLLPGVYSIHAALDGYANFDLPTFNIRASSISTITFTLGRDLTQMPIILKCTRKISTSELNSINNDINNDIEPILIKCKTCSLNY
jgi:hypothetical protein